MSNDNKGNDEEVVKSRTRTRTVEDDSSSSADGGGGSGRKSRGRRRGRRLGGGGGDGSGNGSAENRTQEEISKSGTRVAAKKQRRKKGRRGRRSRGKPAGLPDEVRQAVIEGQPRTMLVSAGEDRTQIAVLEERTVVEHYVTRKEDVSYVGNIYMARVQNVLPGMEAAFLDIGKGRNGVLYAGEVMYDELDLEEGAENRIENALRSGQTVLVQVTKDPMGSKGARLTMQLSLAGRYMVLAPHEGVFGISRKLPDDERDRLRTILKRIKPSGVGVIVRTAAADADEEQLQEDLERLQRKWERVEERAKDAKALEPVYEEPDLVLRVIRDHFGPEFEELVIDSPEIHAEVETYLGEVMPEALDKLELYKPPKRDDGTPLDTLFAAYHVNDQLRKALETKVWLPSGGYLIVEKTEAMTIVDVNTGKFTGSTNLEETVLKTNLEAAEEVVRQLRLRDIGGMIIIDFIDMLLESNRDQVIRRIKRELLRDRTKTRVSEISKLGLVQMTRKNVSQGLIEVFSETCPKCDGRGLVFQLEHL